MTVLGGHFKVLDSRFNMAATEASPMADTSMHVTIEDQQKINVFARKNSKLGELKDEIEGKKKELQNLEDAADELLLVDDEELIPYQIGEVFVNQTIEQTQALLEEEKKYVQGEIAELEEQVNDIKTLLSNLKVQLYAKFGKHINLEADEEMA
ncbi:prefoldin subunit 4-like isoform X1 [Ptychodera flava]|uniref:prefoldin subunit 4-like isoform X1 n=2 Tax=Ptychodera flava TaxID=63121 RepID=UPI00396AB016